MAIFRAENVQTAVEMAEKFKKDGTYNWFRGQTQNWPLVSTLYRKGSNDSREHTEAVNQFYDFQKWVGSTKGLESFASDENILLAIAQHHGLATTLIDFTTNPAIAGYFATSGKTPSEKLSCIYCLDTTALLDDWHLIKSIYKKDGVYAGEIQLIEAFVPDLWRLEAQSGVFISSNNNFLDLYSPDCIQFPNTGLPSYPSIDDVYPPHQSQLEILINDFLNLHERRKGRAALQKFMAEIKAPNFHFEAPPELIKSEHFFPSGIPFHSSWNEVAMSPWSDLKPESVKQTLTVEIKLNTSLGAQASILYKDIKYGLERALDQNPDFRNKAVRFLFSGKGGSKSLQNSLNLLWAGIRKLPLTNSEVAEGVGRCLALSRAGTAGETSQTDLQPLFHMLFGESIQIEYGLSNGNYGRALVAKADLLACVRPDINDFLLPSEKEKAKNIEDLLLSCFSPQRLMDFRALAKIFATQIAPYQVLFRSEVVFSPVRLNTFGIP